MSEGKTLLTLFLIALVIRAIFIFTLQDGYYFSDSARYDEAARHIIEHGAFAEQYGRAPLYPAILAALYSTVGEDILIIRLVQVIMSSLIAILIAAIGFRKAGYWPGTFAGGLWCVYPMGVFVAGTVYPTTALALLLALGIFFLVPKQEEQAGVVRLALAGLFLGLCLLGKPIVIGTIAFIFFWLLITYRDRRILSASVFLVSAILTVTPWTIRNFEVHNRLVPIESRSLSDVVPWANSDRGSGQQVQLSDEARAAFLKRLEGPEGEELRQALKKKMRHHSQLEQTEEAGKSSLVAMATRMAARFPKEFVSFFELYPRRVGFLNQDQRDRARAGKNPRLVKEIPFGTKLVMGISAFSVAFLYVFALLGIRAMWLSIRTRPYLWLYLGVIMSFAAGYATNYGKIRYRVPVDPYIILLSAAGLYWTWRALSNRARAPLAGSNNNSVSERQGAT